MTYMICINSMLISARMGWAPHPINLIHEGPLTTKKWAPARYLKFGTFVHAREVARPLEP